MSTNPNENRLDHAPTEVQLECQRLCGDNRNFDGHVPECPIVKMATCTATPVVQ